MLKFILVICIVVSLPVVSTGLLLVVAFFLEDKSDRILNKIRYRDEYDTINRGLSLLFFSTPFLAYIIWYYYGL